ncbi:hypothetical protein L1049_000413 [Liquidambar formosana]|uniref:Uncharacterized protein n=1 Tax=Liquidambar formosana TaxID=63359 RepID=A0AAP0NAZ6_LIQFO
MAKDRNGSLSERENAGKVEKQERDHERKSRKKVLENSGSEGDEEERKRTKSEKMKRKSKRKSRKRHSDDEDSYSSSSSSGDDDSGSSYSDSEDSKLERSGSESEDERRKRKRRERRRRREKEDERERRRRRKEKERKRRRKEKDEEKKKRKKKKEKDVGKKGAVTNSWGKYGIIRETDMWNKRPEFTAWLAEVKQVNLESLPNWEEKQMFKQFMEDHNTATFPSKKYYDLDAYHRHKIEKEMKKGFKKLPETERTIFNDEEQRRQELLREREKQKEEQVEALKLSMQSGMAQAMKEQAQLREEMAYQYKLGNFEAAAAIQRRLDPDVPM